MRIRLRHAIAIVLLVQISAEAVIYRRVHRDGTIEFYNKQEAPRPRPAGRAVSSRFDALIERIASTRGVDPLLVKCIIKIESDFNPDAVSPAGAMGLMQLMQDTADYYRVTDPFNPEQNVDAGVRHLKALLTYFANDVPLALAAYHAGLGRVKKRMALPPIQSTIDYVNAVMYLYTGKAEDRSRAAVKKLYRRVERDGTIVIYSR